MAINLSNNVNSAILSGAFGLNSAQSGAFGLKRAQAGITEASINIAQGNRQAQSPQDVLNNAAFQQISQARQLLPAGGDSLMDALTSLQINSRNALASTKVLDVANDTVGRIIDELA
ncbi:hypothetical protein [Aliiglaciecola sp. LCG003]|uniref:hypothetical protein n=1 Tax=Aliiglaciecola sp. LCG003 TaxID=3053655 RepID=UPI002573B343|nr:hypothetical protein [Aliiglaciecola sp. LCG003]WJG09327.1 hypothetical protein QR722_18660 [Aliiglaciecola sp. LCG003]